MLRVVFFLALICASPAVAQNRAETEQLFRAWLTDTIWPRARRQGVTADTFDAAFKGVTLNWDLPNLVLPGGAAPQHREQTQSEFRSPARYFRASTVQSNTRTGREFANRFASDLAQTSRTTGVPPHIILAIWGRESAYGAASIPHNTFQVLGTKGFISTRADYFTEELIAALQIVQSGHIAPSDMRSSWAGAMGQPQFMPSSFLSHAADGDGDGRADIWTSPSDTIRSIGTYLSANGWEPARDWGFEISLPATLSCTAAGRDQMRTIAQWEAMGVTRVSGRPFPAHERAGPAALMLPAGRDGPAFLVTPNFYVLKTYNNSDLYALFVGHVGDRIAYGTGDFTTPWQPVDTLLRSDIAAMQNGLINKGYDVGGADGLVGFKTRRAIGLWQESQGRAPTCWPDSTLVTSLAN